MHLLRTWIFTFSLLGICASEMIKFENTEHILCVADETAEPLVLNPPVVTKSRNTSILIENDDVWDDWSLEWSTDVIQPAIIDRRWEDLETIYGDSIYIESAVSISYSTPVGTSINETISDVQPSAKISQSLPNGWIHTTLYPTVNENATDEFVRIQFNATSLNETYWKIHSYKLRWANSISVTPTILPVSLDVAPCLMLYAYVCYWCNLQVTIPGGSTYTISGPEATVWGSSLAINLGPSGNIELFRNTSNGDNKGQWSVDIRECPRTLRNKAIYEVSLEDDIHSGADRICTDTSIRVESNADIFSCSPGTVGRECDIQCTELFGDEEKYCEHHVICDNTDLQSDCSCSWGYQGSACDEACSDGQWGLSCQNACDNCDVCDAMTGECTFKKMQQYYL